MTWLVRDDDVLAVAEVAHSRRARARGLMGRDDVEGALVLRPCRHVHTFGMRFPIDVAFCDSSGTVLHLSTLPPRRMSRPVLHAAFAIEARAGSFYRWNLQPGDVVEIKG
jgi:uncharacterized protein